MATGADDDFAGRADLCDFFATTLASAFLLFGAAFLEGFAGTGFFLGLTWDFEDLADAFLGDLDIVGPVFRDFACSLIFLGF